MASEEMAKEIDAMINGTTAEPVKNEVIQICIRGQMFNLSLMETYSLIGQIGGMLTAYGSWTGRQPGTKKYT